MDIQVISIKKEINCLAREEKNRLILNTSKNITSIKKKYSDI